MDPEAWRAKNPGVFFLDPEDPELLAAYLTAKGVLDKTETLLAASKAGEGNMNCTLRAQTNRRSFIIKQSRPWVEKYPQFEAPWDRALREIEFYQLASGRPKLAAMMPQLFFADAEARLIVLEDLGQHADYTDLFGEETIQADEVEKLAGFLSELHAGFLDTEGRLGLANKAMRELNGAHIFDIPLQAENGLDLDSITLGLAECAERLKGNPAYVQTVGDLANVYHADGACLLHGDYFPGSFLRTARGPCVIDPEFGYFGRPEFDPAVFVAHMCLARQPRERVAQFVAGYAPPPDYDEAVMLQLAGVEIMRRLVGYAQLPLTIGIEEKRDLLDLSRELVLNPRSALVTG